MSGLETPESDSEEDVISTAVVQDIGQEIQLVGGLVPNAMKQQYGYVPEKYRRSSYLSAVSRMISTGDISRKVSKDGSVYFQLTPKGKSEVKRKFSLDYMSFKKWDGLFMFVIFDIPEDERKIRNRLRAKLVELGFGQLQKSVWISPYHFEEDMYEFLESHGLGKYVYVFTGKSLYVPNMRKLVEDVWRLKRINNSYKKVIKLSQKMPGKKMASKEEKERVLTLYLNTLSTDPMLPQKLLPQDWSREKAISELNRCLSLP